MKLVQHKNSKRVLAYHTGLDPVYWKPYTDPLEEEKRKREEAREKEIAAFNAEYESQEVTVPGKKVYDDGLESLSSNEVRKLAGKEGRNMKKAERIALIRSRKK